MTAEAVSAKWLALREPADAAARAGDLVDELRRHLPKTGRIVIHDLGCGTGSMGRWLAPLLPGPQRWMLHDRDADLLEAATADPPGRAADGSEVTLETWQSDINGLGYGELGDASLITASALLAMLTVDELSGLADLCAAAACPALLTLSVAGRVELTPADPLDGRVAAAFNAHQRRTTDRGALLGPDAPEVALEAFVRRGVEVLVRSSPWRLGASDADLIAEWFSGWLWAACEQEAGLIAQTGSYKRRRLTQAAAGQLRVTVDHADLLVLPPALLRSPR
jgi:trans-aconitate methyltransferase